MPIAIRALQAEGLIRRALVVDIIATYGVNRSELAATPRRPTVKESLYTK